MKNLKYDFTKDLMRSLWLVLGMATMINIPSYKQGKEDLMKVPEEYRIISINNSIEKYKNFNIKNQLLNYGAYLAALEIADNFVSNDSDFLKINKSLKEKLK